MSGEARAGAVDVLVTGGAGFIGGAVVARLEAAGATVQSADIRAGASPTLRMDVTDGQEVLDVFARVKPRTVIHVAAIVDDRGAPETFQRVNVGGTQNVLDAAATLGVERLVHVSSIQALGFDPGPAADERSPLVFDTGAPYFDTKAASEQLVREAYAAGRVPAVVVRPGDVFGPGSAPWVQRPLQLLESRLPMLVDGGRGLMAHAWIDNVVDGILLALEVPDAIGGIFQLTDGVDTTTYRDYVALLAQASGRQVPTASVPKAAALVVAAGFEAAQRFVGTAPPLTRGAIHYLCRRATYSLEASRQVLGYAPAVGLEEAMAILAPAIQGA